MSTRAASSTSRTGPARSRIAFPPQIELGGFGTDSKGTYDPVALTGTLTTSGSADGDEYSIDDGKAIDPELHAWLGL